MRALLDVRDIVVLTTEEWEDKVITVSQDTYNLIACLLTIMECMEAWSWYDEEVPESAEYLLRECVAIAQWEVTQYA